MMLPFADLSEWYFQKKKRDFLVVFPAEDAQQLCLITPKSWQSDGVCVFLKPEPAGGRV